MIDERRPLPETMQGLVAIAMRAYRRRLRLFFGTAFAGLVCEAVVADFRPGDIGWFYAGSIVVDSLIAAQVTLGVVADVRNSGSLGDGALMSAALGRWGIVAIVTTLVDIMTFVTTDSVFGPPEATAYGFLILPIVVFWGSIGFASAIAAIDEKTPSGLLVLSSIGRSVALALARPNIGRLTALALVAVLPVLVETVLSDQLEVRRIAGWQFIGNIPIDALVTGPLQAIFTVFYLDFVRRSGTARP
jgi:hypothetical protein